MVPGILFQLSEELSRSGGVTLVGGGECQVGGRGVMGGW